ncbi:MAG: hypothetical protein E7294_05485 [Lachnospiraceae bacterium]|nr:hypothetical protein [Lachnospiraceae bacterium]
MRGKKFLVLSLAAAMLLGGCGEKNEEQTKVQPETPDSVKMQEEDIVETADSKEPPKETQETSEPEKQEMNTEETDGESETAAETKPSEPEKELWNNGGLFVQYRDQVYFHAPDKEGMQATALFGEYLSNESGTTMLYSYDTTNGELKEICHDHGFGSLVFSEGELFLEEIETVDGEDKSVVKRLNLKSGESVEMTEGSLLGGDGEGTYAAALYYSEGTPVLCVYCGEQKCLEMEVENFINFVGITKEHLIYQTGDYDEQVFELKSLNLDTAQIMTLGELPKGEYEPWGMPDQFVGDGTHFYMTYGFYEGTGHFFAGAYLIEADADKENSLKAEEMKSVETNEKSPAIALKDGRAQTVDGIPLSAGILPGSEKLGYYDETGKAVPVADGYAYERSDETVTETEAAEYVNGMLFVVKNVSDHVPEEDIGWREAYRRRETTFFKIDPASGEAQILLETRTAS